MDYEEHIRVLSYDTLSEEINGLRIEISELKNKEFDLECEVKRLREALDWVRREETRKEADYIWEGVEEILAGDPRWKEMIE
tara:strand:+ start:837 stop:1082 length:246 start_codon:yes stop_codon:yes gene_type:complete